MTACCWANLCWKEGLAAILGQEATTCSSAVCLMLRVWHLEPVGGLPDQASAAHLLWRSVILLSYKRCNCIIHCILQVVHAKALSVSLLSTCS